MKKEAESPRHDDLVWNVLNVLYSMVYTVAFWLRCASVLVLVGVVKYYECSVGSRNDKVGEVGGT
jgi:hypothetical protein